VDTARPGQTKPPTSNKSRSIKVSDGAITALRGWRKLLAARDLRLAGRTPGCSRRPGTLPAPQPEVGVANVHPPRRVGAGASLDEPVRGPIQYRVP
jgi:hypothetical protein